MNDENDPGEPIDGERQMLWESLIVAVCEAVAAEFEDPVGDREKTDASIRALVEAFAGDSWIERLRDAAENVGGPGETRENRLDAMHGIVLILARLARSAPPASSCHR